MISANAGAAVQLLTGLFLLGVLAGCGPAHVIVTGKYPPPLIEPLPLTLGVWYGDDFAKHKFSDINNARGTANWEVSTGAAQVQLWDALLTGMFTEVVHLKARPTAGQTVANVDAILIPHVQELQYAIPVQANASIKVYEIWMRYGFELLSPNSTPIADWSMTSYGKTPTAFLQTKEEAVNLAGVMALRDAGANFATSFTRVPAVAAWLQHAGVHTRATTP